MNFNWTLPHWCWMWPWLPLLALYTHWGWLNPDQWSWGLDPDPQPLGGAAAPSPARRATAKPEAPWPDEPAIRQQLSWRGLRMLTFKTGPQRAGTTEVRLDLQWQGPLAECLDMWQSLALLWPQMHLDALTLQSQSATDFKVHWRGWWRQMVVPRPLPALPTTQLDFKKWSTHRVFHVQWFQSHQMALWRQTQGGRQVLPWLRPEQLQWVAYVHGDPPQAWVSWQQHTVAVAEGDRLGQHGGVVRSITAKEMTITEGGLVHRLRPRVAESSPMGVDGFDATAHLPIELSPAKP